MRPSPIMRPSPVVRSCFFTSLQESQDLCPTSLLLVRSSLLARSLLLGRILLLRDLCSSVDHCWCPSLLASVVFGVMPQDTMGMIANMSPRQRLLWIVGSHSPKARRLVVTISQKSPYKRDWPLKTFPSFFPLTQPHRERLL